MISATGWFSTCKEMLRDPVFDGFVIYLLVILVVGFLTYRFTRSIGDFLLAGRRLGPWLTAFSERASGESAWLLLGLPGVALAAGMADFWVVIGCLAGIAFSWLFIARPLRRETERLGALTLPHLFDRKFPTLPRHLLRVTATLIITFFFTYYIAAQFNGAGKVLNQSFGISQYWGMSIGAVIILFYTMMGGFIAVVWTDLVQGIIMIVALVLLPVVGIWELGGLGALSEGLTRLDPEAISIFGGAGGGLALLMAINGLSWGLGYMGQPHLLTRFMAIRQEGDLKKGFFIAMAWAIPAFVGAYVIGLIGWVILSGDTSVIGGDQEKILPWLARSLLHPALAGVLISGAIAAMMSTADSQLLVTTSAVAEDVYHQMIRPEADQRRLVGLTRLVTLLVGIFAFALAITTQDLVFKMVSYAWGGLGASFGPALLLALWWKRTSGWGVFAGLVSGTVMTISWPLLPVVGTALSARFAAFFIALGLVVVVSLLDGKSQHDTA
ncbi:MAG: sodium/proline symporter [Candidatus Delongbacteria bacterium]|nr:sodium/proline symporter [Candidatus Delongbacteria bacterium]